MADSMKAVGQIALPDGDVDITVRVAQTKTSARSVPLHIETRGKRQRAARRIQAVAVQCFNPCILCRLEREPVDSGHHDRPLGPEMRSRAARKSPVGAGLRPRFRLDHALMLSLDDTATDEWTPRTVVAASPGGNRPGAFARAISYHPVGGARGAGRASWIWRRLS